jgi:hypothetical protein
MNQDCEEFRQVVLMIIGSYKQTNDTSCLHDLFSILMPYTHKVIDSLILKYNKHIGFDFFDDLLSQSYLELDHAVKLYDYTLNDNFTKYYGMRLSNCLGNFIKREISHYRYSYVTFNKALPENRVYEESYQDNCIDLLPEELDDFEFSSIGAMNSLSRKLNKYGAYLDFRNPFLSQFDSFSTSCFSLYNQDQKVVFFFRNLVDSNIKQIDIADFLGKTQATISYIETDLVKRFVNE